MNSGQPQRLPSGRIVARPVPDEQKAGAIADRCEEER
jgi:hypothetical protein